VKPLSVFLLAAGLVTPVSSMAAILSQDSFSAYTVGAELPGQNPTITGYLGAWADVAFGNAEPAVLAGSLAYGNASYTAGGGEKIGKAADGAGIST
jgi:hypothetical protein